MGDLSAWALAGGLALLAALAGGGWAGMALIGALRARRAGPPPLDGLRWTGAGWAGVRGGRTLRLRREADGGLLIEIDGAAPLPALVGRGGGAPAGLAPELRPLAAALSAAAPGGWALGPTGLRAALPARPAGGPGAVAAAEAVEAALGLLRAVEAPRPLVLPAVAGLRPAGPGAAEGERGGRKLRVVAGGPAGGAALVLPLGRLFPPGLRVCRAAAALPGEPGAPFGPLGLLRAEGPLPAGLAGDAGVEAELAAAFGGHPASQIARGELWLARAVPDGLDALLPRALAVADALDAAVEAPLRAACASRGLELRDGPGGPEMVGARAGVELHLRWGHEARAWPREGRDPDLQLLPRGPGSPSGLPLTCPILPMVRVATHPDLQRTTHLLRAEALLPALERHGARLDAGALVAPAPADLDAAGLGALLDALAAAAAAVAWPAAAGAQGPVAGSQSSSTPLPDTSRAAGEIDALASLQSPPTSVKPSPSSS